MAMFFKRLLMATAACAALGGCNTANKHIGEEDPFLGEAVKYNAAAQIINPDPVYPEGAAEPEATAIRPQVRSSATGATR
jgi:hypothetical protein